MALPLRPLGDYWQLLQKNGLLADQTPLPVALLARTVTLVSCDSQQVVPGALFIVKGAHFKGEYLAQALEKGAFLYLADREWPEGEGYPCLRVTDVRRAMALLADFYYGHPSGRVKVVGITGTKGKSTTACYLKSIFDAWEAGRGGRESGIIGSIDTYDGLERFESHLTTPEPLDLQRHLSNAAETGVEYLSLEVSSQALKYDRMDGVELSAAVFLNIGEDHISPVEHPDFEDYFTSKLKIFAHSDLAVVNLDCDHAQRVLRASSGAVRRITFSQQDPAATVYADRVYKQGREIRFHVRTPRLSREFRLTMPGLFNVSNALAAIAVCEALDIPEQFIYEGLSRARVPGRMEIYENADGRITAIVDYAHNKLSFETLFQSVRAEYPGRRITAVFGCPGKKAQRRRRELSEVAARYAHWIILTEEDSGEERTEEICREMSVHVDNAGGSWSIEPDRGRAIRAAIMAAEEPTVLLITGKGAETRQKRGLEYVPCVSDVEYVKTFLREYDALHRLDGTAQAEALLEALPRLRAQAGRPLAVLAPLTEDVLRCAAALGMAGVPAALLHPGDQAEGEEAAAFLRDLGVQAVACPFAPPGRPQDPGFLSALLSAGTLPVVAAQGTALWDAVGALKGAKAAVLADWKDPGLPAELTGAQARELLEKGAVQGPQAQTLRDCLQALDHGAAEAVILDGGTPHVLLLDAVGGRAEVRVTG